MLNIFYLQVILCLVMGIKLAHLVLKVYPHL